MFLHFSQIFILYLPWKGTSRLTQNKLSEKKT